MSLALIIAGVALWSLLGGTAFAQEQVLIFQDNFEVSETETTDLGFENDERQSGALGVTTYSDSSEDLTVINSEWAPGKLSLFPEPGSEWVAVSPDHNFAFGSPFTIEFEVDAGLDDEDNASGDWAAVVFGATSKNSWVISADSAAARNSTSSGAVKFSGAWPSDHRMRSRTVAAGSTDLSLGFCVSLHSCQSNS